MEQTLVPRPYRIPKSPSSAVIHSSAEVVTVGDSCGFSCFPTSATADRSIISELEAQLLVCSAEL